MSLKTLMTVKSRFLNLWIKIRSSFWFVPSLMILGAGILAGLVLELDAKFGPKITEAYPRVFETNALGARSILSGIATSMIGIAGVTFSITIVALSLASAQYTSRILRNFMRDPATQVVLGVFVSIFVYCLIVLRSVRGGDVAFVPPLAVMTGILLSIVGIGFFIFFIHHVAISIQASAIISKIGHETFGVIDRLYPRKHEGNDPDSDEVRSFIQANSWEEISSIHTGHVQNIDMEGLIDWAEENNTTVRLRCCPGDFVIEGKPIFAVAGKSIEKETASELNKLIGVASFRTFEQDATFGIRQLVDISLKALSPGVNDTTTAVNCLNYLGAILGRIGNREIPHELRRKDGSVRLVACVQSYHCFVREALSEVRQNAKGNVAVHLAILDTIRFAFLPGLSSERREVLLDEVKSLKRVADAEVKDPGDQKIIQSRIEEVTRLLRSTV